MGRTGFRRALWSGKSLCGRDERIFDWEGSTEHRRYMECFVQGRILPWRRRYDERYRGDRPSAVGY